MLKRREASWISAPQGPLATTGFGFGAWAQAASRPASKAVAATVLVQRNVPGIFPSKLPQTQKPGGNAAGPKTNAGPQLIRTSASFKEENHQSPIPLGDWISGRMLTESGQIVERNRHMINRLAGPDRRAKGYSRFISA